MDLNPEGNPLQGKSYFTFKLSAKAPKAERAIDVPCDVAIIRLVAARRFGLSLQRLAIELVCCRVGLVSGACSEDASRTRLWLCNLARHKRRKACWPRHALTWSVNRAFRLREIQLADRDACDEGV